MPDGWAGWDNALEEGLMAERYGWLPHEIDAVDKHRVRQWWAVKDVVQMAQKYLGEQNKGASPDRLVRAKVRARS